MSESNELLISAAAVRKHAYAPYSKFPVGAAVLSAGGHIYAGCNVENVSFPCGTCAEESAIAAMVAAGESLIKEILIMADGKNLIVPCGACLQRISEFADQNTLVHLAVPAEIKKTYKLQDLIPVAFK